MSKTNEIFEITPEDAVDLKNMWFNYKDKIDSKKFLRVVFLLGNPRAVKFTRNQLYMTAMNLLEAGASLPEWIYDKLEFKEEESQNG
jgi:hypothetical protein